MSLSNAASFTNACLSSIQPDQAERIWAFLRGCVSAGAPHELPDLVLDPSAPRGWRAESSVDESRVAKEVRYLLDLYAPLCVGGAEQPLAIAHLGQSIDGYVAGADGISLNLSSEQNIVHLHRLRALFGAILVGRKTVIEDDPTLTTRLVSGRNPVRVVLDPRLRCSPEARIFNDQLAETIVVCNSDAPVSKLSSQVHVMRLRDGASGASLRQVLELLKAEGLPRVFVEGGGVTVSRALREGVLRRLHIAVAPVLIGQGRPGVQLGQALDFKDALRPPCTSFAMGSDVLFDFEL